MSASFLQNKDVRNHVQQIYSNSLLAHTVMKCEFLKGRTMQATVHSIRVLPEPTHLRLQMLPLSTTSKQYLLESTCITNDEYAFKFRTLRPVEVECNAHSKKELSNSFRTVVFIWCVYLSCIQGVRRHNESHPVRRKKVRASSCSLSSLRGARKTSRRVT